MAQIINEDEKYRLMMQEPGAFSQLFGITPRNRILEFAIEMRNLDFSIGGVIEDTGLTRATAYNIIKELLDENFLKPTRKVGGTQLYTINKEKREVKILIKAFNLVLKQIAKEVEAQYPQKPIEEKPKKKEMLVEC